MKTIALLAAAGLAASSPLAPAQAANLSSFQMRAHTPGGTGALEGTYVSEVHSTSTGPSLVVLSNDTTKRLTMSFNPYSIEVISPAPAPGAKPSYFFYKYVGPGANTVPLNVGVHDPQDGFSPRNQSINGKSTLVMELGTSDTLFDKALGCPVTTKDGAAAQQVVFWSEVDQKPAGCQVVALEIV